MENSMPSAEAWADVLQQHFPAATAAAETYSEANAGQQSRRLVRRLAHERVRYEQFVSELLLLSQSTSVYADDLHRNVGLILGVDAARRCLEMTHAMGKHLCQLKNELSSTGREPEVLEKMRTRSTAARANAPQVLLQRLLDELSRINESLSSHLIDPHIPLPLHGESPSTSSVSSAIHRDRHRAADVYRVVKDAHSRLQEPLMAYFCCQCPSCSAPFGKAELAEGGWKFRLRLRQNVPTHPPTQHPAVEGLPHAGGRDHDGQHVSGDSLPAHAPPASNGSATSAASQLSDNTLLSAHTTSSKDGDSEDSLIQDLHWVSDNVDLKGQSRLRHLDGTGGVLPGGGARPGDILVSLKDILCHRSVALSQKARMDLAFRLTVAVLQLHGTSWVGDSWSPDDWAVEISTEEGNEISHLFVRREFSAQALVAATAGVQEKTVWPILARDPVLARLGLCLIELAFGRTLADMRRNEPGLVSAKDSLNIDKDSLDLLAARTLLSSPRILNSFGRNFADTVSVCVNQQYRERRGARIKVLATRDDSFIEQAKALILAPLYQEVRKYFGYDTSEVHVYDKIDRSALIQKPLQKADLEGKGAAPGNDRDTLPSLDDTSLQEYSIRQTVDPHARREQASTVTGSQPVRASLKLESSTDEFQDYVDAIDSVGSVATASVPAHGEHVPQTPASSVRVLKEPTGESTVQNEMRPSISLGGNHYAERPRLRDVSLQSGDGGSSFDLDFDNFSESTDSAFIWPSDGQSEPARLPTGHPFLKAAEGAVRVAMKGFSVVYRAHGSGAGGESRSVSQGESSKKRERSGATNEAGQPNGGDEEATPESPATAHKKRRPNRTQCFACPFLKMNPVRYRECSRHHQFNSIARVKQHLMRKHQRPIYCPRCMAIFEKEDERNSHCRSIPLCDPVENLEPEGISTEKKRELQKKVPSNLPNEKQWYLIFDTLFPNHSPRPESPYIHPDFVNNILGFQDFLTQYGPSMMKDFLTSSGLMVSQLDNVKRDLDSFLHGVLKDGLEKISSEWVNCGGLAAPDAASRDATSGTFSEIGQPMPAGNSTVDTEDQSEVQQQLLPVFGTKLQFHSPVDGGASPSNLQDVNMMLNWPTSFEDLNMIIESEAEVVRNLSGAS